MLECSRSYVKTVMKLLIVLLYALFEDSVEEKMKTLDTINLFELLNNTPTDYPNTNSSNHKNSLFMGSKNLQNDDAIAKCTSSRTRMAFSVNVLNLKNQSHLESSVYSI